MARELSPLQKAYAEFFFNKLDEFGVETPAALSDEKKIEFFNSVKKDWKKEKRELAKDGIKPVAEDISLKEKVVIAEHIIRTKVNIRKRMIKESKKAVSEAKSIPEMIQDADKYKKELSDLKKALSKSNTETNKAKVAAKEEQLRRVSTAIRNARAAERGGQ